MLMKQKRHNYFFVDDNREFGYKKLGKAVQFAEKKVLTSKSGQIRVYKTRQLSDESIETECVAFVNLIDTESSNVTTVFRDKDIYSECV